MFNENMITLALDLIIGKFRICLCRINRRLHDSPSMLRLNNLNNLVISLLETMYVYAFDATFINKIFPELPIFPLSILIISTGESFRWGELGREKRRVKTGWAGEEKKEEEKGRGGH